MNASRILVSCVMLGCLLLGGCLRVATAPMRAERAERAEAAFDRLAQVPPETAAAVMNRRMGEALKLTPEQRPKVEAINLKYAQKLHDVAASDAGVRSKARDVRQLNHAKMDELKPILTPDQFTRLEEMKDELRRAAEHGDGSSE